MLPFDNKSEFQVLVDQAEGTPLEATHRRARDGTAPRPVPEVAASRSTPAPPRPSTSTASCATTSCGRARAGRPPGEPRRGSTSARSGATTSPSARPALVRSPGARGAGEGGRDPARAARAGHAGGGDLRAGRRRARDLARQVRGLFADTEGVVDVDNTWRPRGQDRPPVDREKASLPGSARRPSRRLAVAGRDGRRGRAAGRRASAIPLA